MKSLVVAPHTERKHASFPLWAAATSGYDRLLAIETQEREYAESLGVPYVLFEPVEHPRRQGRHRICGPLYNQAWDALLERTNGFTHILCLDTDVIPRGDILAAMEAEWDGSVDFVRHGVPWRAAYHRPGLKAYETSCTFAAVTAWQAALDLTYERGELATLYGTVGSPDLFSHKDIYVVELDHLDASVT